MTDSPDATTVWIVDDDLGFVWWLGELFTAAGCRALPALSCDQAISLKKTLNVGIDLLVVNLHLRGVGEMLRVFTRVHPRLKIVAIGPPTEAIETKIRPWTSIERPAAAQSVSRADWLKRVRKLLKEMAAAAAV